MPDEFDVLTGELQAHAGKVDGYMDRMRAAVDAANTVTMNNDAFGVVCQPFALLLQPFEEWGVRTLQQAADTLADSAEKVRDTTEVYTTRDDAQAATFRSYERDL